MKKKKMLFFVLTTIFVFCSTKNINYAESIDYSPRLSIINEESSINTLFPSLPNLNELNFKYDIQGALEWSERNLSKTPPPFEDMLTEVEKINNDLRLKYKNRVDLYEDNEKLRTLDNFINATTETRQDMVLYSYYTAHEFDIHSDRLFNTYDQLLKDTEYGIDHGYLIGELGQREIGQRRNGEQEIIILEISIPKGTPFYGMGNNKHLLPRNFHFEYVKKEIAINQSGNKFIKIKANLTPPQTINDKNIYNEHLLINNFKVYYPDKDISFETNPVGLNAGSMFNISHKVANLVVESLALDDIFKDPLINKASIIQTTSLFIHSKFYYEFGQEYPLNEQKRNFEELFLKHRNTIGATFDDGDTIGINAYIGHTNFSDNILKKHSILEEYASIFIHEFMHFAIQNTNYFKNRKMFDTKYSFQNQINLLKETDCYKLSELLNNSHCQNNWEEFICEAFRAKYHPIDDISTHFIDTLPLTNRFLDNLYDFDAPTSPKKLYDFSKNGNNVSLTFDHSTDNVGVDHYNVYQKKSSSKNFVKVKKIHTSKDSNGLSYANPEEYQENLEIIIDRLAQNTDYEFYVTAVDEALNESTPSNILKVRTNDTEAPQLHGNLTGKILNSVLCCFNLPRATDNVGVEQIMIRRRQDDLVQIPLVTDLFISDQIFTVSGNATNYIDYTIEKGKRYTYTMIAIDAAGNESDPSNSVVIQTSDDDDRKQNEDKAQNTSSTSTTLNLSGLFPGVGTGISSGFKLFGWLFSPLGWVFHSENHVDMNQELYTINDLLPDQSYLFLVVPVDNEGNPLDDGVKINVDTPPIEITDLQIDQTKQTFIQLSWTGIDLPKESISYDIYRNDQKIDTIDGTEQQYVDMDLDPGTTYQYQIKPKIESGLQTKPSEKVRGETLAPYEDQIIRLASKVNEKEIVTYGNDLGDLIQVQPFENLDEQFIYLQYHPMKKAYQLETKDRKQVIGISTDKNDEKKIITTVNDQEDHQFWKLQNTIGGELIIESLAYPTYVFDFVTDTTISAKEMVLTKKDITRNEQQFILLVDNQPPTAPTNLTATNLTDHSVDIAWEASEDTVGVSRYNIYHGEQLLASTSATTLSYTLDNLTSVTEYQLTVKAIDGSENQSEASNRVTFTTLSKPPTNVQATEITQNSVTLTWDKSENHQQVTGYDIYQDGKRIKTVAKETTNWLITDLLPATRYTFSVKTRSLTSTTYQSDTSSTQAITKPVAPDSLEITDRTSSSLVLNWNRGLNGQELVGYDIYQNKQFIQTLDSTSQSYKVTNLSVGEGYEYSVKARTNQSESEMSQSIIGYTTIPEPKNFKSDFISATSVHLYWDVVQNFRSNPLAAYAIYQDNQLVTITGSNDVSIKITDLEPKTTYKFSIKALYDNNISSEVSNLVITTLDITNGTYFIENLFSQSIIEKSRANDEVLLNSDRQEFLEQQWKISYDYTKKAYRFFTLDGEKNLSITSDDRLVVTSTPEYWSIDSKSNADDSYVIRSQKNDKKVLFANELTKKLELVEYSLQNNKRFYWKMTPYDLATIEDGVYFIKSNAFESAVMSTQQSLTSIHLFEPTKSVYEQWKIEYNEKKQAYTISSMADQQRYLSIGSNSQTVELQQLNTTSYWSIVAGDNNGFPGLRFRNDAHRELFLAYSDWELQYGELIASKSAKIIDGRLGHFSLEKMN